MGENLANVGETTPANWEVWFFEPKNLKALRTLKPETLKTERIEIRKVPQNPKWWDEPPADNCSMVSYSIVMCCTVNVHLQSIEKEQNRGFSDWYLFLVAGRTAR